MQTYEISQYEKRNTLNSSNRNNAMKNTASSSNYNYDTYFNMNLQRNVNFDNFELEQQLRDSEKEAKKLRIEVARLCEEIKNLEDNLDKKEYDNSMLLNDNKMLNAQKDELASLLQDATDKLNAMQHDLCSMNDQYNTLMNEYNKMKHDLSQSAEENDVLKKEIHQLENNHSKSLNEEFNKKIGRYEDEVAALKSQLDKMYIKNRQLQEDNKKYQPLEEYNKQLIEENNQLKNDNKTMFNNSNALIDDLKNQIDLLRNHATVLEKEKKNLEKARIANKKTNDDIIKEANEKIAQLTKDNEALNKKAFDYKKLNQALLREKDSLIGQLNQLQSGLQRMKPNNQLKNSMKGDNQMLIECLKGENEELKYQNQKLKRMADILLQFVNNISLLFEREELNFDHCKDYTEDLQEALNVLTLDIEGLINNKDHTHDDRWKNIEDKLLYRAQESLKQDQLEAQDSGQNYKLGKCSACDLGCNTTLKGCSPLFAKKDLNPTNLPQYKMSSN